MIFTRLEFHRHIRACESLSSSIPFNMLLKHLGSSEIIMKRQTESFQVVPVYLLKRYKANNESSTDLLVYPYLL